MDLGLSDAEYDAVAGPGIDVELVRLLGRQNPGLTPVKKDGDARRVENAQFELDGGLAG